jgi:hypothetical protein
MPMDLPCILGFMATYDTHELVAFQKLTGSLVTEGLHFVKH